LEIVKRKFKIDILNVNSSEPNFFPFIGYYPQWDNILEELTSNIPTDGFWKALDIARLSKYEYYSKNHLSVSYAMINNPDFFKEGIDMGFDQIDFNTGAIVSPFLEGAGFQETTEELTSILEENEDFIDNISSFLGVNESISNENLEGLNETTGVESLKNNSHYTIIEVQYEGLDDAFRILGSGEYNFDLFKSLGYNGEKLEPSEKIYNNLMGAFLTELDTNVLCSEVTSTNPPYVKFNSQLLDQLGLLLYLADIDFDIATLQNYSFELLWRDNAGLKRNFVNLVNLEDEYDIVNFLPILGFSGISSYPAGILDPLNNFKIRYNISGYEPNINIKAELIGENATYGAFRDFDFNITAENVGQETCWGVPTSIPITLDDIFPILIFLEGGNPFYAEEFKDGIWTVVNNQYPQYESLEEFFNYNKKPKIFSFDTFGDGAADYYFPDPLNITSLYPFNEKMDEIANMLYLEYPTLIVNLGLSIRQIKDAFTNPYSAWNAENWKLESGEIISYLSEDYSISNLDSFTEFYGLNFTIDSEANLPNIRIGEEYGTTTPEMALKNDSKSWVILSQQEDFEQQIDIQFLTKNNSYIDLVNNSIDRVSLQINLTDSSGGTQFEIFNFNTEEYENLQNYLVTSENSTRNFSITKYNNSINWIFQDPEHDDYTMIFRIRNQNSEEFNISIENIDITFEDRDINHNKIQSNLNYASKSGISRYYAYSNSITLSTENMASLVTYANLTNYSSLPGDISNYTLSIKNIGCEIANNITVEIPIPGIINNQNNFTLKENNLLYKIDKIFPRQEKIVELGFHIPNSGKIDKAIINYNNNDTSENYDLGLLSSNPNHIFYIASVDYNRHFPHLNLIDINLNSSINNPKISDLFNISLKVKNVRTNGSMIEQINISAKDQFGNLQRIGDELIRLSDIGYNQTKTSKFLVNKTEWKGYLYPAINKLMNEDSVLFQIRKSNPLIIGKINFSIIKQIEKKEVEIGDIITINIKLTNTGTIGIKEININDMLGFPQDTFTLIKGKLIHKINILDPNQTLKFEYTIKAQSQAISTLKGASIEYYYLHQQKISSNDIEIKVSTPKSIQYLYLIIPSLIGLVIIGGYNIYLRRYRQKKQDIERNEMRILYLTSRDSILNIETSLKEILKSENSVKSSFIDSKNNNLVEVEE